MSRRIMLQKPFQVSRRLEYCYICGKSLPIRPQPGRKKLITREHVIPKAFLGDPPASKGDRWAVVLDVHRDCEESGKQKVDHWLRLFQDMHEKPPCDWPEAGHIRGLPIEPGFLVDPFAGTSVPLFRGAEELFEGVWRWIRGLHAAIYAQFLPKDAWHFCYPPVAAFSSRAGGPSVQETEQQSSLIRAIMQLACSKDRWDGVIAWGGASEYKCVWWFCRGLKNPSWVCFWTLQLPGLAKWSQHLFSQGQERPWHGNYVRNEQPAGASFLSSSDFPAKD